MSASLTIILSQSTDFITVDRATYLRTLRKVKKLTSQDELAEFLSTIPVLADFTRISLLRLAYHLEERKFKRNEAFIRQGETADYVFIVVTGEVKVSRQMVSSL